MADKDKGDLRKRLIRDSRQAPDEPDEDFKLASELAGTVGKTVEKATDLGLRVVEDVGLKVMEILAPSKPAADAGVTGAAASFFNRTRVKAPEVSGRVASKLTELLVTGGLGMLRAMHQTARKTRRPD
jgi:hypothetical protein